MLDNAGCCSNSNCGCQIAHFPTEKTCPACGRRLRLSGRPQLLEFRLACPNCDYQGSLLSQEELREVM